MAGCKPSNMISVRFPSALIPSAWRRQGNPNSILLGEHGSIASGSHHARTPSPKGPQRMHVDDDLRLNEVRIQSGPEGPLEWRW